MQIIKTRLEEKAYSRATDLHRENLKYNMAHAPMKENPTKGAKPGICSYLT